MAKKKGPFVQGIPDNEQTAAAMYFTLSNCALLHLKQGRNLRQTYNYADGVMQEEVGESIAAERRDWDKIISKAEMGSYEQQEWDKEKVNWDY